MTDPAVRSQVESMLAELARQPHVSEISSPYGPRGAAQISPSGQVAFANATFDVQANKITAAAAQKFVDTARAGAGQRGRGRGRGPGRGGGQSAGCGWAPVRDPGRWDRAVHRVRLVAGDGPAARDRRPVARNRCRRDRPALPRAPDGLVHQRARAADRPRGRRRLRAVHRHALPPGAAARTER